MVYKEANYNFETVMTERVHVNATSPTGLDVEFDITLPKVPCNLLKIDANDPSGQPQSLHLDRRHHIWKHRVRVDERTDKNNGSGSNNGKNTKQRIKFIGNKRKLEQGSTLLHEEHLENELEKMKKEHGIGGKDDGDEESGEKEDGGGKGEHGHGDDAYDDDDDEYKDDNYYDAHEDDCGSCYGAGDEGECCDTCEDIKRVYQRKGWKIEAPLSFEQCKKELDHKIKMQEARKKKLAAIGNNKDGNNKDGNNKDNNNKDGNNKDNEKESEEGCNVHGLIALDSGGGNFHLAPGRSHDDANMGDIGAIFELLLRCVFGFGFVIGFVIGFGFCLFDGIETPKSIVLATPHHGDKAPIGILTHPRVVVIADFVVVFCDSSVFVCLSCCNFVAIVVSLNHPTAPLSNSMSRTRSTRSGSGMNSSETKTSWTEKPA